jgi:hypothetical protein
MVRIILHLQNEDPILAELDELPTLQDTIIVVRNPRKKDGKDITYLDADVNIVIWPISRINFIEILEAEKEEEIITSFRE